MSGQSNRRFAPFPVIAYICFGHYVKKCTVDLFPLTFLPQILPPILVLRAGNSFLPRSSWKNWQNSLKFRLFWHVCIFRAFFNNQWICRPVACRMVWNLTKKNALQNGSTSRKSWHLIDGISWSKVPAENQPDSRAKDRPLTTQRQ